MSFWCFQFLQKTNEKIRPNYYDTSSRIVFVHFLEEVFRPKGHFEINWPLPTHLALIYFEVHTTPYNIRKKSLDTFRLKGIISACICQALAFYFNLIWQKFGLYCEKLFSYVHAMNVALDSCLVLVLHSQWADSLHSFCRSFILLSN